ncbi:uncharacterized protein LOC124884999 [Girardinichthys multiradiatus]|uniref:uncharacterized protein LOC124884999 n=1 Tax=Girardinichthys multiradiatus TaxID=208333 RepID=UPI001FAC50D7|nr:uncharacterized protein LOC124884999 [Girardinichthys multiradiatus]
MSKTQCTELTALISVSVIDIVSCCLSLFLVCLQEMEQELTEQRGLTQAISRQSSRVRLSTQEPEDRCQLRLCPAETDVEVDSAQKKWDHLHSWLLALEESWLLPPSEVTDSSMKGGDGTAGRMIGTKHLKELQSPIRHLRELGHTSTELPNQVCSVDSHQALDEGLFHVLHGTSLSLSSIHDLLHSPTETPHEDETQLLLLQLQVQKLHQSNFKKIL